MKRGFLRGTLSVLIRGCLIAPAPRVMGAPPSATMSNAGSIVYRAGNNIWLAAPNGSGKRMLTRDGTVASAYKYPT